ncbi:MAG: M23 family metallopeptidase [Nitrospiraceae bacterium]|nr:MAG: M23 family metallopeptidase [Nitrospiraceae bacterium]
MKTIRMGAFKKGLEKALSDPLLFALSAMLLAIFSVSPADAVQLKILPSKVHQGDAFMISIRGLKGTAAPSAVFNGKPVLFSSCGKRCLVAIGAIDLETEPGVYRIPLKIGKHKTTLRLRVLKGKFETIHLTLPDEKVSPSPEDLERITREAELLNSLWEVESERLWKGRFVFPLHNPLSTPFGTKRIINEETVSIHRGLDMKGLDGEEIRASNRGRVVLTEELFFGGNTVILDHGQRIFTVYMHMSGFTVSPGDLVSRNDVIGYVGSSGRSSGPHLHFGVKVLGVNANPVSITGLKLGTRRAVYHESGRY